MALVRIREEVVRLIDEATGMMSGLFAHFKDRMHSGQGGNAIISQMYDCLVYLGDLARYRVMFGEVFVLVVDQEDSCKDYRMAGGHYRMAIHLAPTYGHAYNQLGLLASYTPDLLAALHHYLLAAGATVPFVQARTNLQATCLRILGSQDLFKVYGTREELVQNLAAALLQTVAAILSHASAVKSRLRQIEAGLGRVSRALALLQGAGGQMMNADQREVILADPIFQQAVEMVILAFEVGADVTGSFKFDQLQLRLASLLMDLMVKGIYPIAMKSSNLGLVTLTAAWLHYSNFFQRLKVSRPMASQLYDPFARTTAALLNRHGIVEEAETPAIASLVPELQGIIGIGTFKPLRESLSSSTPDNTESSYRSILAVFAQGLLQADILAWDRSYESFSDWEARLRRQSSMSILAKGKLEHEVERLQSSLSLSEGNNSSSTFSQNLSHLPWTLPDTDMLLAYGTTVISGKIASGQMRLLITLPVLCELDRAKTGADSIVARTIIRRFTDWLEAGEPFIRLQGANEQLSVSDGDLTVEQRGLAAAMRYYCQADDDSFSCYQLLTVSKGLHDLSVAQGWKCVGISWLLQDSDEEEM